MEEKKNLITIYTDGACKGNPGEGGWGVYIILSDTSKKEFFGYENSTTNNRMELTAAIEALKYFKDSKELEIYTDSNYLKQGITVWIKSWKQNNWKSKQKKSVKNVRQRPRSFRDHRAALWGGQDSDGHRRGVDGEAIRLSPMYERHGSKSVEGAVRSLDDLTCI